MFSEAPHLYSSTSPYLISMFQQGQSNPHYHLFSNDVYVYPSSSYEHATLSQLVINLCLSFIHGSFVFDLQWFILACHRHLFIRFREVCQLSLFMSLSRLEGYHRLRWQLINVFWLFLFYLLYVSVFFFIFLLSF